MHRRAFVTGSLGLATAISLPISSNAARSTSTASQANLPGLALTLTDTAFEIAQPLAAGRYEITVSNTGTLEASHFALGKIPDDVTDAQYEEWLTAIASGKDETEALSFEAIAFIGVPDWPQPGASVTGMVDIEPGRYFLFDPFSGRKEQTIIVEGDTIDAASPEPEADLTVVLREMEIVLPETAFTSEPMRWKIENTGAMSHEVAVVPVPPDFTDEHLRLLFTLPEDATPPPSVPEFIYQPAAAIGILAGQHTSWLDELKPGRYLAACMLPFSTGYPHAMDGMYRFLDVA